MKKTMTYENLDTGKQIKVEFHIFEKDDHWVAEMRYADENEQPDRTPVFYGTTPEQAERQLRKVLDKDYDLVSEAVVEG